MEKDTDIKLRQYLTGELPYSERLQFEKEIQADDALQAESELQRLIYAREQAVRKARLRQMAVEENLQPASPSGFSFWGISQWRGVAAAAAVVILLGAFWFMRHHSTDLEDQLKAHLELKYPAPTQVMGTSATPVSWSEAGKTYREQRFGDAALQFETLSTSTEGALQQDALFYAGISYLFAGNDEQAISLLKKVPDGQRKDAADWYTALALLRLHRYEEGKEYLRRLQNTSRSKEAAQLLALCNS